MKRQHSPRSSRHYDHNEEALNFLSTSGAHKNEKGDSWGKDSKRMSRQHSPRSSRHYDHNEEALNFPSTSGAHKNQKGNSVVKHSKRMKRQHSPRSSRHYEHNEETRNFSSTSGAHKNQKGDSWVKDSKRMKRQHSPRSSRPYEHNEETRNFPSTSDTHKNQKRGVPTKKSSDCSIQPDFNSPTSKRREGTRHQGTEYEKLMCALLALKFSTSSIVTDFKMKTNSVDCGDFDDVALEVTFEDGQSQIFLLQLKHVDTIKNFPCKMLLKYIKSIRQFKDIENINFILYTNNSTSINSKPTIYVENECNTNEEVVVRELQNLDPKKLLLMNSTKMSNVKNGTNVFQFELNQSSGSVEGLDNHLKHFYFFAHQTNATEAESLIRATLGKECGIKDAYSSDFISFIKMWWSEEYSHILTKNDVVVKLAESAFTPFIQPISGGKCTEKSKLLREAIMKFDMTIFEDTKEEVIANIWNTASDDKINLELPKYFRLGFIKDLSPKKRSIVLWNLDEGPLILKAEKSNEAQVKQAIKLLEKVKKKKVVLLLANATKDDFPGWNIFQDLSDLSNQDVYKDIAKKFLVSLQGRKSISLDELLNFDQENARTIGTTELIKMTQEVITIGRKEVNTFDNYIPRTVSTITLGTNKMSEICKKTNSLLIICDVSQSWNEAIRQLNLHVMELDQYIKKGKKREKIKVNVLLTSNKWDQVHFSDICKETERNVHLLQVFDDKSCTSVLSKEKRFSLDIMKSERARVGETDIFTYFDHPLNVICSPPGMGKSSLVSRLSSICPSTYWSVRVNLINHKTVFKEECVHNEILHKFVQKEEDALAVKIRSMLLQNKRIYFFFDGLDEIDSDCIPLVLDFIKYIFSLGYRVWITSRENLEQTLLEELNMFPKKIEDLTDEQKKTYIQKRLQDLYQKEEVVEITNKIDASVDIVNSRYLLGVPLQLFMITENFRDNTNLWTESDQEIFVLTKMYKIFFQGKKKHQHRKLGVHEYENQLGFDFDLYLEQYELPALKSCLDTTTFDKLGINLEKSQKFLEKLKTGDPFGIVSRVTDDNQAIFNHQTYAEYFACAWLKKNLDKVSLLQDDLFTKEKQNLKLIFDIMLAENSALHLAIIYRDKDLVSKHLDKSEVKDEGGRNSLQLLCTYGVKHPPLRIESRLMTVYNNNEEVSPQYKNILKKLLDCHIFQKDNIFQLNSLDYAIRHQNLFAVEKILERFENKINLEKLFELYDIDTLAYYSSQMAYPNLLRAVIKANRSVQFVKFIDKMTLLHVAVNSIIERIGEIVMEEKKKVIRLLKFIDINKRCSGGRTALHLASAHNDYVIVEFLLDQRANINLTDECGKNALHCALKSYICNAETVQVLIDRKINVEAQDNEGCTPLHVCCDYGHVDALKILLDNNANMKAKDSMNQTPFYHALLSNHCDCIKVILDRRVDFHDANSSGNTVLQAVLKNTPGGGNYACLKILLNRGYDANINAVDNSGKTVLHTAIEMVSDEERDCIKLLLDHGADVNAVDNDGKTVLHTAFDLNFFMCEFDIIQLLLSHGVDANKRDKKGRIALDYAIMFVDGLVGYEEPCPGYRDILKILFDATAHEKLVSTDYLTFLHYAVYEGNCLAVKLFLEGGFDLDNIDAYNEEYPLYFAVENEHLRSDLLLNMTNFILDYKTRNIYPCVGNDEIIRVVEEDFLNDNESVGTDDSVDSED